MPKFIQKRSTVASKVPLIGDLELGELAVNTADEALYIKNNSNQIINLIPTQSDIRGEISATGDISYDNATGIISYTKQTSAELLTSIKTVDGDGSGLDADQLHSLSGTDYQKGIGLQSGSYDFGATMDSSTIPVGFSRIYTSNNSPTGSHSTGVTFKSQSSRGFQILCDDVDTTGLYYRNQSINGTLWAPLHRIMSHVDITSSTNIDSMLIPGMYISRGSISNYPGNRSYITLQVQASGPLIQQQVFNDAQIWTRRSTDTGSTWTTWVQI